MRVIKLLPLFLMLTACAHYYAGLPSEPKLDSERIEWVKQLESESERPPLIAFGATGKMSAIAGAFPINDRSAASASNWLMTHRNIFGLGNEESLTLAKTPDFPADNGSQTGDDPGQTAPMDVSAPTVYIFDVVYKGYPYSGMQITTTISGDRPTLVGVFNTFAGTRNPGRLTKFLSEESAWSVAEAQFGATMTRVEAVQVWFDPSWALQRVPGTQELNWRLLALDPGGAPQYAFVRAADNRVSYATPLITKFAVHQTHKDRAGNVLWDNQTLPNGCTAGSAGCSGIALSESLRSRDIVPKVVDLWYTLTMPGGPGPFVWPFSGLNRAPFDNQGGRAFSVVVANPPKVGLNVADFPTRDGFTSTYNFPEGTVTRGYMGHEYGHVLLGILKHLHPGNTGTSPFSPPAAFTEAMADFIGIVTEQRIGGGIPPPPSVAHWQTDFSIGDFKYDASGGVIEPPPVAWDIREGNCFGAGRARLGRAFITAWGMNVQAFGDRPKSVGEATYRGWWIDIMRSFALLPDFSFPTIKDFYDATVSRRYNYGSREEWLPVMFLENEMQQLGLDRERCF